MRFTPVLSTLVAATLFGAVTASPIPPAKAYYTEPEAPEGSQQSGSSQHGQLERRATHQQGVQVDNEHSPLGNVRQKPEGIAKEAREFKFSTIHPSVVNSQNTACIEGDCNLSEIEETCLFNKNSHSGLPCTPKSASASQKDDSDSPPAIDADTDTKIITPASSANKVVQLPHRRRRAHHP